LPLRYARPFINLAEWRTDQLSVVGINYPTEVMYEYKNGWDRDPEITYDEYGDGLVPGVSLEKCSQFRFVLGWWLRNETSS